MKLFGTVLLVLGGVCAAQAQEVAALETAALESNGTAYLAPVFAPAPAPKPYFVSSLTADGASFFPVAKSTNAFDASAVSTSLTLPFDAAEPAAPSPKPKFLYSRNDIVRWELGLGFTWVRFRSSIFNASAVGIRTSVTYNTNEWFGIEGNVSAAFAPEILDRAHVKLLIYGGGPKIAWHRYQKWDPWLHAILGGAHEQPQTAGNGRNAFAVQLGGGADYNINARFSARLEANLVHTNFFGQSQNNFQLGAGLVLHF
jgi:opacity protein-like surface antigen